MLAGSAARFLATAQALTDDGLYQASALPGWTRAHVLTHLAHAADSRTGLLRAARAGRVGQQYPSGQARADAIDAGARRPPSGSAQMLTGPTSAGHVSYGTFQCRPASMRTCGMNESVI